MSGGKWTKKKGSEWGKVDGPKGGKWTVPKVEGPSKVDGPAETGRPRGKGDGLSTKSGRSFRKRTVRQKVNGPGVKWTVSENL